MQELFPRYHELLKLKEAMVEFLYCCEVLNSVMEVPAEFQINMKTLSPNLVT